MILKNRTKPIMALALESWLGSVNRRTLKTSSFVPIWAAHIIVIRGDAVRLLGNATATFLPGLTFEMSHAMNKATTKPKRARSTISPPETYSLSHYATRS